MIIKAQSLIFFNRAFIPNFTKPMKFNKQESFGTLLKAAFIIGIPLALLYTYNFSSYEFRFWGVTLEKIYSSNEEITINPKKFNARNSIHKIQVQKSPANKRNKDTIAPIKRDSSEIELDTNRDVVKYKPRIQLYPEKADSSSQRVLLIGDSQAGGIMRALNDYCVSNGHELVASFTWFSATAFNFGYSDKVDGLIAKYKPSLIFVVLGLNELYAKDLKKRMDAAKKLRAKFNGTPYVWVGPANFKEDQGINSVYEQVAGSERFILSKNLLLPRASDKRHPNAEGYRIWMDYIASKIQGNPLFPFNFRPPQKIGAKLTGKYIPANAAKDKGY